MTEINVRLLNLCGPAELPVTTKHMLLADTLSISTVMANVLIRNQQKCQSEMDKAHDLSSLSAILMIISPVLFGSPGS